MVSESHKPNHAEKYALDSRSITKVGICFDSKERNITEWKTE